MKKVIFAQVLTENGKTNFNGLYDENGISVKIELEKDDEGTLMTILRNDITEAEKNSICDKQSDCEKCPIFNICQEGETYEDTCN